MEAKRSSDPTQNDYSAWVISNQPEKKGMYHLKDEKDKKKAVAISQAAKEAIEIGSNNNEISIKSLRVIQRDLQNRFKDIRVIGGILNKLYRFFHRDLEKKLSDTIIKQVEIRSKKHLEGERLNLLLQKVPTFRRNPEMRDAVEVLLRETKPEVRRDFVKSLFRGNVEPVLRELGLNNTLIDRFPQIYTEATPQGSFEQTSEAWDFSEFEKFCKSKRDDEADLSSEEKIKCARFIDTQLRTITDERISDYFSILSLLAPLRDKIDKADVNDNKLLSRYLSILEAKVRLLTKVIYHESKADSHLENKHALLKDKLFPDGKIALQSDKETAALYFLPQLGLPPRDNPTFGFIRKKGSDSLFLRMHLPKVILEENNKTIDVKIIDDKIVPIDERTLLPRFVAAHHLAQHGSVEDARKILDITFASKMLSDEELSCLKAVYDENPSLQDHIKLFYCNTRPYHVVKNDLLTECDSHFGYTALEVKLEEDKGLPYNPHKSIGKAPKIASMSQDTIPDSKDIPDEEKQQIFNNIATEFPIGSGEKTSEAKPQVQSEYKAFLQVAHSILKKSATEDSVDVPESLKRLYEELRGLSFNDRNKLGNYSLKDQIAQDKALSDKEEMELIVLASTKSSLKPSPDVATLMVYHAQERLKELFPKEDDCAKISAKLISFLSAKQKWQKSERIARTINSIVAVETEEAFKKLQSDLLSLIPSKIVYNPVEHPRFQVFEVLLDILIKPEQFDSLQKLSNVNNNVILQLLMGSGKTFLLLPLLGMLRANGDNISTVMLPEALLPTVLGQLKASLGGGFNQMVAELPIPQGRGITVQDLNQMERVLQDVQERRGCLLLSPNKKHILLNTFSLFMKEYEQEPSEEGALKVQKLARILAKFEEKESVIGDEIDDLLKTMLQYIIPLGKPVQYDKKSSHIISELVLNARDVAAKKELELDFSPTGVGKPYSIDLYHSEMKNDLAESALGMLQSEEFVDQEEATQWKKLLGDQERKNLLLNYLTIKERNEENEEDCKRCFELVSQLDNSLRDRIAELRFAIVNVLPKGFFSECNKEYGVTDEQKELLARPFSASQTPTETQFSNAVEQVSRTVQSYIKLGPPLEALKEIEKQYPKRLESLFGDHAKDLESLKQHLKINSAALRCFLQEFVFPTILVYPENIASTPQKLVDSSLSVSGMTGTSWNVVTMSKFTEIHSDMETEVKMLLRFLEKEQTKDIRIEAIEKTGSHDALLKKIENDTNSLALIDSGGWLRDVKVEDFALNILKVRADIDEVVFHNNEGKIVTLKRKSSEEDSFEITQDPPSSQMKKRFTVYAQQYTVGTHIDQADDAGSILTVGKKMILRDFEQSIYRMRKIQDGQKCLILVDDEVKREMESNLSLQPEAREEGFSKLTTLYRFLMTNQVQRRLDDNYTATHQRVKSALETTLRRAIFASVLQNNPDMETARLIWKNAKSIFVSREVVPQEEKDTGEELKSEKESKGNEPHHMSAWDRYGRIPQRISKADKVEKEISQYKKTFSSLAKIQKVQEALGVDDYNKASQRISTIINDCYNRDELDEMLLDEDMDSLVGQQTVIVLAQAGDQVQGGQRQVQQLQASHKVEASDKPVLDALVATDEVQKNMAQMKEWLETIETTLKEPEDNTLAAHRFYTSLKSEFDQLTNEYTKLAQTISERVTVESRMKASMLLARVGLLRLNAGKIEEFSIKEKEARALISQEYYLDEDACSKVGIETGKYKLMRNAFSALNDYCNHFQPNSKSSIEPFLRELNTRLEGAARLKNEFETYLEQQEAGIKNQIQLLLNEYKKHGIAGDGEVAILEQSSAPQKVIIINNKELNILADAIEKAKITTIRDEERRLQVIKEKLQKEKENALDRIRKIEATLSVLKENTKYAGEVAKFTKLCEQEIEKVKQFQEIEQLSTKRQLQDFASFTFSSTEKDVKDALRCEKLALTEKQALQDIDMQLDILSKWGKSGAALLEKLQGIKRSIIENDYFDTALSLDQLKEIKEAVVQIKDRKLLQELKELQIEALDGYVEILQEHLAILEQRKKLRNALDFTGITLPEAYAKKKNTLLELVSKASQQNMVEVSREVYAFKERVEHIQSLLQKVDSLQTRLQSCTHVDPSIHDLIQQKLEKVTNEIKNKTEIDVRVLSNEVREATTPLQECISCLENISKLSKRKEAILSFTHLPNNDLIPTFKAINDTCNRIKAVDQINLSCKAHEQLSTVVERVRNYSNELQQAITAYNCNIATWNESAKNEVMNARQLLKSLEKSIHEDGSLLQDSSILQSGELQRYNEIRKELHELANEKQWAQFLPKLNGVYKKAVEFKKLIHEQLVKERISLNLAEGAKLEHGFEFLDTARQAYNLSLKNISEENKASFITHREKLESLEKTAKTLSSQIKNQKKQRKDQFNKLSTQEQRFAIHAISKLEEKELRIQRALESVKSCTSVQEAEKCIQQIESDLRLLQQNEVRGAELAIGNAAEFLKKLSPISASTEESIKTLQDLQYLDSQGVISLHELFSDFEIGPLVVTFIGAMVMNNQLLSEATAFINEAYKRDERNRNMVQGELIRIYQASVMRSFEQQCEEISKANSEDESYEDISSQLEGLQDDLYSQMKDAIVEFRRGVEEAGFTFDNQETLGWLGSFSIEAQDVMSAVQANAIYTLIEDFESCIDTSSLRYIEEMKAFVDVQKSMYSTIASTNDVRQFRRYNEAAKRITARLKVTSDKLENQAEALKTQSWQSSTVYKCMQLGKRIVYQGGLYVAGGAIASVAVTSAPILAPVGAFMVRMAYQDAINMVSQPVVDKLAENLPQSIRPYAKSMMQLGVSIGSNKVYTAFENEIVEGAASVGNVALNVLKGAYKSSTAADYVEVSQHSDNDSVDETEVDESVQEVETSEQVEVSQEQEIEHGSSESTDKVEDQAEQVEQKDIKQNEVKIEQNQQETTSSAQYIGNGKTQGEVTQSKAKIEAFRQNVQQSSRFANNKMVLKDNPQPSTESSIHTSSTNSQTVEQGAKEYIPAEIDISQIPVNNVLRSDDIMAYKIYAISGKFDNTKFTDKESGKVFNSFWDAFQAAKEKFSVRESQSVNTAASADVQVHTQEGVSFWDVARSTGWAFLTSLAKTTAPSHDSLRDQQAVDNARKEMQDTLLRWFQTSK